VQVLHGSLAVRHWCATLLPQETYNYYYLPFCKHKPNGKD
jgi:hypothetical protein